MNKLLRSVSSVVERKLMRDFARDFGLVYFGTMSAQNDEYVMVRGITLHTNHKDSHFIVGNYRNYDVTALQRRVTLSHPHHGTSQYKWSIVQSDLHRQNLPHVLITVNQDDRVFFDNMQIKLANFQRLSPSLIPNQQFAKRFSVFSATDTLDRLPEILTPEIMMVLLRHFRNFDVELVDDQVIVYTSQPRVTMMLLREMLREALWLGEQLDGGDNTAQQTKTPVDQAMGDVLTTE